MGVNVGNQPADPHPLLSHSFYPLPSTLSHGWFPLGSSQPPLPNPGFPALSGIGTERAQAAHRRPHRWATGNAGMPPHTCSLLAQGLGQTTTHTPTHTHTDTHTHRCAFDSELSLYQTFPHIDLQGGCTWKYSVKLLIRLYVRHFFRHAVSLPHTAALPVTHRCLRAYLQLFLNMCSPDISVHIHHDKHT